MKRIMLEILPGGSAGYRTGRCSTRLTNPPGANEPIPVATMNEEFPKENIVRAGRACDGRPKGKC